MKILITGSKGQLGWELVRQSKHFDFDILGVDLSHLDITDRLQVESIFKNFQPSLVINAAAYTNVDKAETDQKLAFAVNRDGPANISDCCSKADIPHLHISTDFVFDGNKGTSYVESDPVSPLSIYGKSKAYGEDAVRSRLRKHIILRTAWLYGVHGHNFVKTMLKIGKEKRVIKVVADQYGSPTRAADLAGAVLTIAEYIRNFAEVDWGTYHYCGLGVTTWHGFTETIFDIAGEYGLVKIPQVKPISTADYPTAAKRPVFSALDCEQIKKNFGIIPKPWQESLKITIGQIMSDTSVKE